MMLALSATRSAMSFDHKAANWDANPMHVERANAIAECMRRHAHLTTTMHGFEFGCGTGLLSFALRDTLGRITLADTSTGMLEVLEQKITASGIDNMRPLCVDLTAGPLPEERYDVVYSAMTLHHIPDTRRALQVSHTLLADGATLCVADLDHEDGSFHEEGDSDEHPGFQRHALQALAESCGFSDVRFDTAYIIEKRRGEVMRQYPVFLMVARKPATA